VFIVFLFSCELGGFNSGGFFFVVASITLVKGFILRIGMDLWSCMACSLLLRCEYASSRYARLASWFSRSDIIIILF